MTCGRRCRARVPASQPHPRRGAGGRVTGEGEHAERRGGAGRWPDSLGSAAAVLSVELNRGAERAQPAPRPHQPLRALQDACNPGGRARSSNPRGERCAPAARHRLPAAGAGARLRCATARLQLQRLACGRCQRRRDGRMVEAVASLGSGWVSRDTMPASIISISGFSTP